MTYDVIIPCYNAAEFLSETIASVQSQTIPPTRVLGVDDGSSDDTLAVLRNLLPKEDIATQSNSGPGAATMAGVHLSNSSIIAFIDADDLWQPNKMEMQLKNLTTAPEPSAVFCRMDSFGANDLEVDAATAGWSRSTLVVHRKTFDTVGPIRDTTNFTGEMVDWIARADEAGVPLVMIEDALAWRRLHPGSLTRRTKDTAEGYLAAAKAAILRKRRDRDA